MKMTKLICLAMLVLSIFLVSGVATGQQSLNFMHNQTSAHPSKYSEWMKSVVRIEIPLKDEKSMIAGSGWILSSDGTIVTNYHVIKHMITGEGKEIDVMFSDGTFAKAEVVGGDEAGDVGIIKVNVKKTLRAMPIANSLDVTLGQEVFLMGNPLDQGLTLTHGYITAPLSPFFPEEAFSYFESDATLNPGNSGGALLDANGNLIGMPSMLESGQHGNAYGFAISSNDIKWAIEKIMAKVDMTRAKLGLKLQQSSIEDKTTNIFSNNGVLVIDTANPSILKGDIIVGINDTAVASFNELHTVLGKTLVGDKFTLTVIRQGKQVVINMVGSVVEPPADIVINLNDLLNPKKNDFEHHRHFHKHHYHKHHREYR